MGFSAASILNKVAEGVGKAQAVVSPALEQGARALESEDPNIVKTIVNVFNESSFVANSAHRLEIINTVMDFGSQVIKSLDVSQDNEIPSHTSEPTLPQHIPPPVGPETQTPPLNTLRQTAHSVIPLLVSMARSVEQDLSQRQRIPPPITHFLQSASSSSRSVLPIANQVSQNIVQNATSSGDIPSQTTTPQAPLDPSDAQILIDVLHEQGLQAPADHENRDAKLRTISVLKRLCIEHDKLPQKLFLPDIECNIVDGPSGSGLYADVYRGECQGKPVALKLLRIFRNASVPKRNRLKKSFCREVLIWSHSSNHPHVLPILGVNDTYFKHGMCMVLPWMEHGSINHFIQELQNEGHFEDGKAWVHLWLLQIAQGLESLHEQGIVHGDLQAANVLIDDQCNVRVTDFGLSALAEEYTGSLPATNGRIFNLLAPEMIDHFSPIHRTKASDVYAFGCVCLQLYTGKRPYGIISNAVGQFLHKMSNGVKPERPQFYGGELMSDQLWSLVGRCLSTSPADRPTAGDLVSYLGNICETNQFPASSL